MDNITIITWPRGRRSLMAHLLRLCLGPVWDAALAAGQVGGQAAGSQTPESEAATGGGLQVPGRSYLVEYEAFPQAVVARFEGFVAKGGEDSAAAFRRFASQDFTPYEAFTALWVTSDFVRDQVVVDSAELRANALGWLPWALGVLVPDMEVSAATLARAAKACEAWAARNPAPGLATFRHYDAALFAQLADLKLRRDVVQQVFREVMGREVDERSLLQFQTIKDAETLRGTLMRSEEYQRRALAGPNGLAAPDEGSAAPAAVPPVLKGVKPLPARRVVPEMQHVMGVSWPRSGHHLLVRLLTLYFGDSFGYCQFYETNDGCCKSMPCSRADIHMSKNHDFTLDVPQIEGQKYLIQYRDFVPSVVSNFELYVRNGAEDSQSSFLTFALDEFTRYHGFVTKWVEQPLSLPQLILRYEDMLENPGAELERAIAYLWPGHAIRRPQLARALKEVDGLKIEKRKVTSLRRVGVHEGRDVSAFRHYDALIFERLENMKLRKPEVLACLARLGIETGTPEYLLQLQGFASMAALEEFLETASN